MKYPGLVVQTALYNALHEAVVIDDMTLPVVSHTEESLFLSPFILIGVDQGAIDIDAGNLGQRRNIEISVWARGPQGRRQTKEALFKIIEIIDARHEDPCTLDIEGFNVYEIEWVSDASLPVQDDGETYQAIVDFSIQLSEA